MDLLQASERLIIRVNECHNGLQKLVDRAEKAHRTHRTHRTGSTGNLLTNVERSAKNAARSLQNWKRDFGKGTITDNQRLLGTTHDLFESLGPWIEATYDALESRLFYSKLFILGFITSKRLVSRSLYI